MPDQRRLCDLCKEVAKLLGGKSECSGDSCSVTVSRKIDATILGRRVRSDEVLGVSLVFEDLDPQGRALGLLEATLREEEIDPFIAPLLQHGIKVSAIHNHWLVDRPRLMYVHAEAIADPLDFARAVQAALAALKR